MNRKEFHETVDFNLMLREWATTQPGYKPPVTEADVEAVMVKIRPLLKKLEQKSSDPAKLKYSMLIQIIKKEPKPKPYHSLEVTVINRQQFENELLKEKLIEMAEGKIKVTDLGRRFVREFERAEETGK